MAGQVSMQKIGDLHSVSMAESGTCGERDTLQKHVVVRSVYLVADLGDSITTEKCPTSPRVPLSSLVRGL
jgi:hypothetical protein